jgi:hypothetical protein
VLQFAPKGSNSLLLKLTITCKAYQKVLFTLFFIYLTPIRNCWARGHQNLPVIWLDVGLNKGESVVSTTICPKRFQLTTITCKAYQKVLFTLFFIYLMHIRNCWMRNHQNQSVIWLGEGLNKGESVLSATICPKWVQLTTIICKAYQKVLFTLFFLYLTLIRNCWMRSHQNRPVIWLLVGLNKGESVLNATI